MNCDIIAMIFKSLSADRFEILHFYLLYINLPFTLFYNYYQTQNTSNVLFNGKLGIFFKGYPKGVSPVWSSKYVQFCIIAK